MPPLLSIDEALGRVLARVRPLPAEAVRAADTPGRLPVVFRIAAGRPAERPLAAGEAMEISTGGAVPEGADAVVPIENVVERDNRVEIAEHAEPGAHVRQVGGDVTAGAPLLGAGTVVGAAQVGALTAAGVAEVACARRPRVVVLSTGTELRPAGEELGPGQIYESNGPMLAAALVTAGAEVERLGPVADDEAALRDALARGLDADLLVSSGGVSVGPHDLVRQLLAELGVEEDFWGVAVRPGKPIAFGTGGGTLVFGLPGNPVSALVAVELFVRPALLALQGAASPGPSYQLGRLAAPMRRNERRDELARARTVRDDSEVRLEPLGGQESHMIARAAAADALVFVPRGDGELAAGDSVRYLRL